MITPIETPWESDIWRSELSQALRTSEALLAFVGVDHMDTLEAPDFPVMVPRGFASRMAYGDPHDPLLNQVLGRPEESVDVAGFVKDPLQETAHGVSVTPALLQKYQHRALLIATTGCAVNCRYCFRRHFPYHSHRPAVSKEALAAIENNSSLSEIILSGGDPLLLDDTAMAKLCGQLANMAHIKRLRIHSRIPIVLPERITQRLLQVLETCRLPTVLVVHANHANELDASTARAFAALKSAGVWLLNQSVLLKDINDTPQAQIALAEALFAQGVMPYYLHMPDKVAGTHHFYVEDQQALQLHREMQAHLPGYLVPKLVREVPGAAAKTALVF